MTAREQLTQAGLIWDELEHIQLHPQHRYWDLEYDEKAINSQTQEQLLDFEFDHGYGGVRGPSLVAYTKDTIYFTCCYDGAEWVSSIPRHPDPNHTPAHYGGG